MTSAARAGGPPTWPFFGGDISNSRGHISNGFNVNGATQVNPRNAPKLALKWSYDTAGDVSATPTVDATGVYFPDYAGFLYALDPVSGAKLWSHYLGDFVGAFATTRASPAIGSFGEIIFGIGTSNASATPGARVLSVNKTTGALNWVSIIDTNPNAEVTTSAVIYNNRIYVGTTAREESLAQTTPGFTPVFRASVVCLDEATGTILWQTYTVPPGYTGGGVWGSNPAVWPAGNSVIVGTGNNWSVPDSVSQCYISAGTDKSAQYACMDPTNYVDALVSLDLTTGAVKWTRRFAGADTWVTACARGPLSACPTPTGLDNDFASAPNMMYDSGFAGKPDDRGGTTSNYFLGAGQKTGNYMALNPANGGLLWTTFMGRGQILWGSALNTDDHNGVYVALFNFQHYTNTLVGRLGVPVTSNGGAVAQLDPNSGTIQWQVPTYGMDLANPAVAGSSPGPVTFTNRVVLAGSTSGYYQALSLSGRLLWTYFAGGSVIGGPSVYNETIYWGAGAYKGTAGTVHKMYAFAIPG